MMEIIIIINTNKIYLESLKIRVKIIPKNNNPLIIALSLFLFGMLSSYFNLSHRIHINEQLIVLQNGIFGKSYNWSEFSNVILKDELLTLDFKNNRLIQLVVDVNFTPVNEIEFNEFCRILLKTADSSIHL